MILLFETFRKSAEKFRFSRENTNCQLKRGSTIQLISVTSRSNVLLFVSTIVYLRFSRSNDKLTYEKNDSHKILSTKAANCVHHLMTSSSCVLLT